MKSIRCDAAHAESDHINNGNWNAHLVIAYTWKHSLTVYFSVSRKNISLVFFCNPVTNAYGSLENFEDMYPRYYMRSDVSCL